MITLLVVCLIIYFFSDFLILGALFVGSLIARVFFKS